MLLFMLTDVPVLVSTTIYTLHLAPFHASIMDVNNSEWPAEKGLDAINTALNLNDADGGWWNEEPITIDTFSLEGTDYIFHATL